MLALFWGVSFKLLMAYLTTAPGHELCPVFIPKYAWKWYLISPASNERHLNKKWFSENNCRRWARLFQSNRGGDEKNSEWQDETRGKNKTPHGGEGGTGGRLRRRLIDTRSQLHCRRPLPEIEGAELDVHLRRAGGYTGSDTQSDSETSRDRSGS